MKATIKQLFLIPAIAMLVVMIIALIRPAAIFGGIHYGGILGIFIPVIVIVVGVIIWFYITQVDLSGGEVIYFSITLLFYALSLAMMIIGISIIPQRTIYIKSAREFNVISHVPQADNINYSLEGDIDFNGASPSWLGKLQNYHGIFDGNGYTIKNLTITRANDTDYGFGLIGSNYGTVRNVRFESCIFKFKNDSTNAFGILAGYNYGEIENCSIINCYQSWNAGEWGDWSMGGDRSLCNIYVGGRVGVNKGGSIEKCEYYNENANDDFKYSIHVQVEYSVLGSGTSGRSAFGVCAGGLVGYMEEGTVSNCVVYGASVHSYIYNNDGTPFQMTGGGVSGKD